MGMNKKIENTTLSRSKLIRFDDILQDDLSLMRALINDKDWTARQAEGLTIEVSAIDHIKLRQARLGRLFISYSVLQSVDISNASLESATLSSTQLVQSKLTGAKLNESKLRELTINECKADFSQWQFAETKKLVCHKSDFTHAYFNNAKLEGAVFRDCDLTDADFSGATLTGADLRGSNIKNIRVALDQLRGVTVTADQALYLTGLMGLKIEM